MIINNISYIKEKKLFLITINNELNFEVFEDTLIKFNLYKNKELTNEDINNIIFTNDIFYSINISLKYMRNLKTEYEIITFLKSKNINNDVIEETIIYLHDKKYLDDENYANLFIKDKLNINKYGHIKIKELLRKKGISRDIIENSIKKMDKELEMKNLKLLIEKKIKSLNSDKNIYGKIFNHMLYKGYDYNEIKSELRNMEVK